MDSQKIGTFLRELRKEKNLTQEQLAEILGVSGRTVSRWETGSNMPDLSIMIELADYYDIDIKELLNGERKSEMDKELKETLKTVADYTDIQRQEAVKASSYGFLIVFIVSAIAIVAQLIVYADMKLVIGETAALFYQYLSEKTDCFLTEHDFSKEEVLDGMNRLVQKAGYGDVLNIMEEISAI